MLIGSGAVAVVEAGTAGMVEREMGVVVVARDWRRWTVLWLRCGDRLGTEGSGWSQLDSGRGVGGGRRGGRGWLVGAERAGESDESRVGTGQRRLSCRDGRRSEIERGSSGR